MNFIYHLYLLYFINFVYFSVHFSWIPLMENLFDLFLCYLLCRGGNNYYDAVFWRNAPVLFLSKGGKNAVHEARNGRIGIYRQSQHFSFIDNLIEVLFPICTLTWRVDNYVSRQGKVINRRNEGTIGSIQFCTLWYHTHFLKSLTVCSRWNFSLIIRGDIRFCYRIKIQFSFQNWQNFSLRIMATLMIKRNLAAVSRETPENTWNSQSQNSPDPEMAQEYISQISEEVEGKVTKKFSKEFSRTMSRILGALSKLYQIFLSPQTRTCSVAGPGTSRNNDSENQEPTGHRSLGNLRAKVVFSTYRSGNLNDSEQEETHHKCWKFSQLFLRNADQFSRDNKSQEQFLVLSCNKVPTGLQNLVLVHGQPFAVRNNGLMFSGIRALTAVKTSHKSRY